MEDRKQVVFWSVVAVLLCLFVVSQMVGCTQYNLTIHKTVYAYPRAHVEMNSETQADDNTSNPTTTAEPKLDLTVPLVP